MLILNLVKDNPFSAIGFILAIPIAITVHEFAHAWMANRLGDPTAKRMGRLSLNPLHHLDPFGTIFIFLAGFGWGKPVIYDPRYLRRGKRDELKIAIAGPISNIIAAFVFALPYRITHYLNVDLSFNPFFIITAVITEICVVLAVFNILPIPPLDGSKIIFLFISENTRITLERIGPILLMALIFVIYIGGFNFFGKVMGPIIEWILNLVRVFP
jgi:Zn-dependent protease